MNWKAYVLDSIAFLIAAITTLPILLFLDWLING